ncbi:collagen-binding domain-containing protein [Celeribacter arenosi]|uniref:Choice-of-anchor A domain-containing protein n=1 Tax=Celeribacter arenosi TaxID=792649 RepID=A0ABP7KI49_9RHOB
MKTLFTTAAVLLAGTIGAQAASLTAVELMNQYVLVTEGDVTGNNLHVHGRALVGGNIDMNGWAEINNVNADEAPMVADSVFDELVVLGDIKSDTRVNQSGDAAVQGSTNGKLYFNGGSLSSSFAAPENFVSVLETLSSDLAGLEATALTPAHNKLSITDGGIYSISATDLAKVGGFNYSFDTDETVIINVTGEAATFEANAEGMGKDLSRNVIWNFLSTTTVSLKSSIYGTVLAMGAEVKFTSDIEGSLLAQSVFAGAQVHTQSFRGDLPETPETPVVPLPAGFPLILTGLGAFALLRRRAA